MIHLDQSICVFISISVKAVHIELVSDLTMAAFLAALHQFITQKRKPATLCSDHGTKFVGAEKELKELFEF